MFTSAVTRALRLELVNNLTTTLFLHVLRRFTELRGNPSIIISDNGQTFKAAATVLSRLSEDAETFAHCRQKRITWKFNFRRAPCIWWGALFERVVRSLKRCLRKTIGRSMLNLAKLSTVLIEVEVILNSCPLMLVFFFWKSLMSP